jgi:hypothetical protein
MPYASRDAELFGEGHDRDGYELRAYFAFPLRIM